MRLCYARISEDEEWMGFGERFIELLSKLCEQAFLFSGRLDWECD